MHLLALVLGLQRLGVAHLPTPWGDVQCVSYRAHDDVEHLALVRGRVRGRSVLARVHSECLTGDVFGSRRCDCGDQLAAAMRAIEAEGRGVLVYLRGHEGRGIGLAQKVRAYALQDLGVDTVDANLHLGLPVDARSYDVGGRILRDLGVREARLLTNNRHKCNDLARHLAVRRVPLVSNVTAHNRAYLAAKRDRMGHLL